MILSKKARKALKSEQVKMRIALDLGKSLGALKRWIFLNDERLTQINVINSICKHTGMTQDEIFELETTNKQCKPPQKY